MDGTKSPAVLFDWHQKKKATIIQRKEEFPGKLRAKIDEAAEEKLAPIAFLRRIESKLVTFLRKNFCDRDTEEQIEVAIRFFPNVLSTRQSGRCPIVWQLLSCTGEFNFKGALLIPVLAKLGIELGQFEAGKRGGLIYEEGFRNALHIFAYNAGRKKEDDEHRQLVDESFLDIMKNLRGKGIFKKEDIRDHGLMWKLCRYVVFTEKRFRYLADWDPGSLMMRNDRVSRSRGWLPIHYATTGPISKGIHVLQTVFEVGMFHYPMEMGGLFHKNSSGETSFQLACDKYGKKEVKKTIDGVLNIQQNTDIDIAKALIYAATETVVGLDGIYFLLRREPSVLLQTAEQQQPQ